MLKFFAGLFLGLSLATASAQVVATCDTNGILAGYIVQDVEGVEICRDPELHLEFRGPNSYIICE